MDVLDLESPSYEYCKFCEPDKGCTIYNQRRKVCKKFGCLWWHQEQIPESLRPDKIGVMFEHTTSPKLVLAYVHPDRPDTWRIPDVQKLIRKLNEKNYSVVLCLGKGKGNVHFPTKGVTNSELMKDVCSLVHN